MTNRPSDSDWAAFAAAVTAGEIEGKRGIFTVLPFPEMGIEASETPIMIFKSACGRLETHRVV